MTTKNKVRLSASIILKELTTALHEMIIEKSQRPNDIALEFYVIF